MPSSSTSYDERATAAQNSAINDLQQKRSSNGTAKKVSSAKVHLYAEFLGIDLVKHPYLYDLMEEGLRCPLPEGWKIRKLENDEDGNPVHEFFHEPSGKISNAHPMDEIFLERAQAVIRKHQAVVAAKHRKLASGGGGADDSSDFEDDDDLLNSKKASLGKKSLFRSHRSSSSPAGKKFRYFLYCAVFAILIHFVVHQAVYKIIFEMGKESAMKKQQQQQPEQQQQQQPEKEKEKPQSSTTNGDL